MNTLPSLDSRIGGGFVTLGISETTIQTRG